MTHRLQQDRRGSANAWLLALAALVTCGLVLMLRTGDARGDSDPRESQRSGDPASSDPDGVSIVAPPTSSGGQDTRHDPAEATSLPDDQPFTLRAVDAWSGASIERFWVGVEAFGDMTNTPARHRSEDGIATVPRTGSAAPLAVHAAGYATHRILPPGRPTAPSELALTARMERVASLVGMVRDGESAPLTSAAVYLEAFGEGPGALELTDPIKFDGPSLRRTDKDGSYAFTDLPSGIYRTRVDVGGASHVSAKVTVGPGEWTPVDHWLDQHTRLTVTVLKPDGTPSPRSRVMLTVEGEPEPTIARYSDDDGRAVLGPLTEGSFTINVVSDHGRVAPEEVLVSAGGSSSMSRTVQLSPKQNR